MVHHHISSSEQLLQAMMRWPELSCKILIKWIHFDLKMAPFIYLSGHPSPSRKNHLIKLHWNIELMKSLQYTVALVLSVLYMQNNDAIIQINTAYELEMNVA